MVGELGVGGGTQADTPTHWGAGRRRGAFGGRAARFVEEELRTLAEGLDEAVAAPFF